MYSPCQHPLAGAAMLTVLRRSACFSFGSYWLKEQLERCCQRTGVKVIRIHDVRHSHASLLIHMGTNAVLVQKRLRHKRISTTLGTYAHLYPDCSEQVAEQRNRQISRRMDTHGIIVVERFATFHYY